MNIKKILGSVAGFHMMRHRQHKRFLGSALPFTRQIGRGRGGLLMLGAMALGSYYMRRRNRANQAAQLTDPAINI